MSPILPYYHPILLRFLCCVLLYFLLIEMMEAHKIQEVNKRHMCGKAETNKTYEYEAPPQGCGNSKQLAGADILPPRLLRGDPRRSSRDVVFMSCITF